MFKTLIIIPVFLWNNKLLCCNLIFDFMTLSYLWNKENLLSNTLCIIFSLTNWKKGLDPNVIKLRDKRALHQQPWLVVIYTWWFYYLWEPMKFRITFNLTPTWPLICQQPFPDWSVWRKMWPQGRGVRNMAPLLY